MQLPIAHRVWTERVDTKARPTSPQHRPPEPGGILVFDTETTTDHTQSLVFGAWRFFEGPADDLLLTDEGLFYADELPVDRPDQFACLRAYVESHRSLRADGRSRPLRLLSRSEFAETVLFRAAYKARARVVGFNLPYDLSRLAVSVADGRSEARGGFSFQLWHGRDGHQERKHRPRITIKHLDSKRAFTSFTKPLQPDPVDLIPEGSPDQRPDARYAWRGRFLDLRTLAFALTGEGHSLESACKAFGVPGKHAVDGHGEVNEQYIDYCRQDVAASAALYRALMAEFALHPVDLVPERAYSPASLAKAYLSATGITPMLERLPEFPRAALGASMSAFFGGRAECRIRKTPVPVALVDFTSMYPTVGTLMDVHRFEVARNIVVQDATPEVTELLADVTLESAFERSLWPQLMGFALIDPNADVLPVRAAYDGHTFGIGVNYLRSSEALWYSLPDLVASKLICGRPPKVLRAFRLRPEGRIPTLRTVKLRGSVEIDPRTGDPFAKMVEERQRVRRAEGMDRSEQQRLALELKIISNAGSYGILSEFRRIELPHGQTRAVRVHGRSDPFEDRVTNPEDAGRYCFPPLAACITGAARLMLAMLERQVTDRGGTWAFCDTDSMAIVAAPNGGLVRCAGGRHTFGNLEAVRALTFDQVREIRERFNELNPYDRTLVPDLLKLEVCAHCLVVSAKRYVLYDLGPSGEPEIRTDFGPSEHGLGQLLSPLEDGESDRRWIVELWDFMLRRELSLPVHPPAWLSRPTVTRTTVSSPAILRAFKKFNANRPYQAQIKPFNFMLTAAGAMPAAGVGPDESFRLVAPWERNATRWCHLRWVDIHHPDRGRQVVTTARGLAGAACLQTFASVAETYLAHPEAKSLGSDGEPCRRGTTGLLRRRSVQVGAITLIGKESNKLEERTSGLSTLEETDARFVTYRDNDEWRRIVMPVLAALGARRVAEVTGLSERRVRDILKGRATPRTRHRAVLERLALQPDADPAADLGCADDSRVVVI